MMTIYTLVLPTGTMFSSSTKGKLAARIKARTKVWNAKTGEEKYKVPPDWKVIISDVDEDEVHQDTAEHFLKKFIMDKQYEEERKAVKRIQKNGGTIYLDRVNK